MFEIDINDPNSIAEAREKMKAGKAVIRTIVEPFWNDDLLEKRKIELVHAAKFVRSFGAEIEKMGESPDFLMKFDNRLIGLEIRQMFTRHVEYNGHIQRLFSHAENFYREAFADDKFLVNFWLEKDFNYKSHQRNQYISQITDYVRAFTFEGETPASDFIDHIDVLPHSQLSFSFNEGAYCPEPIHNEIILHAIAEKEEKIECYVANSGTPHQWLLLVSREAGFESFDTEDFVGIPDLSSSFEHVYLLRDFDDQLIRLC